MEILESEAKDSGDYTCTLTNCHGKATFAVKVYVGEDVKRQEVIEDQMNRRNLRPAEEGVEFDNNNKDIQLEMVSLDSEKEPSFLVPPTVSRKIKKVESAENGTVNIWVTAKGGLSDTYMCPAYIFRNIKRSP